MDDLARTVLNAKISIEEIVSNVAIRKLFNSFFVARAASLYDRQNLGALNTELTKTLNLNSVDSGPTYRGLYVQAHSVFESFISSFTSNCVGKIEAKAATYSKLDPHFANSHSVHAARTLAYLQDGNVNGVSYDFKALMLNLGVCFSDTAAPKLTPNVFTISMGNCTPERLKRLFGIIGLGDPFDDDLGRHPAVKGLPGNNTGARAAAKHVSSKLKDSIVERNRIVHDHDSVPQIGDTDVEELANLLMAIVQAFETKARRVYP